METKRQIRAAYLKKRASWPIDSRKRAGKMIEKVLFSSPVFCQTEELYCYISYGEEVSTKGILKQALKEGKKVAVPKVSGPGKMEFYYIDSMEDVKPGFKGILEPKGRGRLAEGEAGLILVPGLACDKNGYRIGYGGGFYDAYLKAHPKLLSIGLFYSIQLIDTVPVQEQDMPVQRIMTEKGNLLCSQSCQTIR
ncbi:5-formyltetrahydrofolate cyclo-ligase [Mediterraneibacter sp. NSJ-55]|uniref:5-formyltetrahydrofolate cyclo-ligase n=1 Tax=Mediterraneibacter hominis TaxID=2763054 RepID=A0A923LGR2_9FIRM|nr:5-formyltetrahydrofolate cyclo-ligase [Mediterraneibacter hominis]MBC5687786.1 5-formyltetrahydrofolate cyclo-ligase [Mediterraneibacter hominis]